MLGSRQSAFRIEAFERFLFIPSSLPHNQVPDRNAIRPETVQDR
jgi:hypothetical protein